MRDQSLQRSALRKESLQEIGYKAYSDFIVAQKCLARVALKKVSLRGRSNFPLHQNSTVRSKEDDHGQAD